MNNKTFIIVISILIVVSIVAIFSYLPTRFDGSLEVLMSNFPQTIGEWKSTDLPLSKRDYEILETKNLIMRDYKNKKGDSVLLYIVYSQDNRKVSHPPEVCYMGSGASIIEKTVFKITDSISATRMLTEEATGKQQFVAYWFRVGNLNTDKYLKQQLKIVCNRMIGKRTSGAMIRISTDIKEKDQKAALTLIKVFTSQIEPLLAKYVP